MFQTLIKTLEDDERRTNAEKDRLDDQQEALEDKLSLISRRKALFQAAHEVHIKSCLLNPFLTFNMLVEVLEQIYAALDKASNLGAFEKE